jgi:RNA polymerase sigma-70 factor (ECF subfamily)
VQYADQTLAEPHAVPDEGDADLAVRVAAGDRGAEAELYRRLAPRVRLYGLRHLRDPAAADDLAQDVLLMTFDSLRQGSVREPEHLVSYVLGTCRRVVAGWRRSAQRRQGILERHAPELVPTAAPGPSLDLDHLARCLTALSERERTITVLSFYAERSSEAIGAELGMSPGNVRVVRHRALGRLRACMEGAS